MSEPNLPPVVGAYVLWVDKGLSAKITKCTGYSIYTIVVSISDKTPHHYPLGYPLVFDVCGDWEPEFMISYDDPTEEVIDPKLSYVDGAW